MLYNSRHNIVVIETPKTASSAISEFLQNSCDGFARNEILIERRRCSVATHISVREMRAYLSNESSLQPVYVAFVRDPKDMILSKYCFYKYGRPVRKYSRSPFPQKLRVIVAKILPFFIWALVYPYKSTSHFVCSHSSDLSVDVLCDYARLDTAIVELLQTFDVESRTQTLPRVNSNQKKTLNRFEDQILKLTVRLRLSKDEKLYELVRDSPNGLYFSPKKNSSGKE